MVFDKNGWLKMLSEVTATVRRSQKEEKFSLKFGQHFLQVINVSNFLFIVSEFSLRDCDICLDDTSSSVGENNIKIFAKDRKY